jgi:hypothetical protein
MVAKQGNNNSINASWVQNFAKTQLLNGCPSGLLGHFEAYASQRL